jgi:hypothetical protein
MNNTVNIILVVVAAICIPTGFVYWMVMLSRGEANAGHFFPWVEPKTPNRFPVETIFTTVGALAIIVYFVGNLP